MKNKFLSLVLAGIFTSALTTQAQAIDEQSKENYFLKYITQLTFEGEKSGEAYFSPDGSEIIFQSVRDGNKFYQIYKMDTKGGDAKLISTGKGKTTCSYFSPDGKKVIYSSSHLDPKSEVEEPKGKKGYSWDFEKSMDIFQANPDGTELKQLTNSKGYDAEATYSHDGKKIVFTSQRDGDLELYIMDSDGKNQKRLTNHKGYDGGAFFSPDGKKIVFRRFDNEGNAQIVIIDSDGKNEKYLTNTKGINWCPSFHPNGKHIVFSSNFEDKKNFELYLMGTDGENLRRITFDKSSDVLPIFSPDGKKLMWTSTRKDKKSQVFIAYFTQEVLLEPKMSTKTLYKDVKFLSDDKLEGRGSGTKGGEIAAKYIAESFKKTGLKYPYPKWNYFQEFKVTVGLKEGKKNSLKFGDKNFTFKKDFSVLSMSDSKKIKGDVVFAGYGITAPEYNYDDYKGLDVKNKIVVLLRHEPQEKDTKSVFNGDKPTTYSELWYKAFNAKKHGAKGIILLNGNNYTDKEDLLMQIKGIGSSGNVGLPFIHLKNNIASNIFLKEAFDIAKIQSTIDTNLRPQSFKLKTKVEISTDLQRDDKKAHNVIGIIEGTDKKLKNEVIIIGAHYDHLGMGGETSLSTSKKHEIHNGADDNASGTAALMEVARKFAIIKNNKRTIAFMAFSGEELGLVGSSYFNNNSLFGKNKKVVAMINMDMIGRLEDEKLTIGGVKTASGFKKIVNDVNSKYDFKLSYFDDGFGPSDHMAFYLKGIPVLFFFTGIHNDYHKPSDDYFKINYPGLNKITDYVTEVVFTIDKNKDKPQYVKMNPPSNMNMLSTGKTSGAYIGAIPDYTSMNSNETGGVKISGVRDGSPADKAGVKANDVIIKFDGTKINGIYDYTYAIKLKKPNDKVEMVVLRDGKEVVLQVIVGKK